MTTVLYLFAEPTPEPTPAPTPSPTPEPFDYFIAIVSGPAAPGPPFPVGALVGLILGVVGTKIACNFCTHAVFFLQKKTGALLIVIICWFAFIAPRPNERRRIAP